MMKKKACIFLGFLIALSVWGSKPVYRVKVSKQDNNLSHAGFNMGTAIDPLGNSIYTNAQGLLFNGVPVLPVMGEFHYSRYPEAEWHKELLKMKAGGINIVASYIFWIHHEEQEGTYNWNGQRNLRKFVETCQEVGLPVVLRIGPWCHGEVRNGGLPEWLVKSGIILRSNNKEYLDKLRTWFEYLYAQVDGLMWKQGGPVIGVQIENEFRGDGQHLIVLKEMVQRIGFDVPLYTRTGWPALTKPVPFGEIIPLYGDYADGFWDRSTQEMPGDYGKSYFFRSFRNSTVIATEQLPKQSDKDTSDDLAYPYFTCELGGGMMTSYHRRINIAPMDVYAMALVRVGSGSNLPGYYMYHGGTNPDGELTTLNESQDSPYTYHNDLPVKTYDFQAPLGEFGQLNPHYHLLRQLHLFLHDFGGDLVGMRPYFPEHNLSDSDDDSALRWAVRSNGESGYVFVNNYHRLRQLPTKENIRFTVDLPQETLVFPDEPLTVLPDASFFMPFNMNMGGIRLTYSSTQPLARLSSATENVYVFASIAGIKPEFMFDKSGIKIESPEVKPEEKDGRLLFKNVKPGTKPIIRFRDRNNRITTILLLNEEEALSCWKGELAGKERLFLTESGLTYHNNRMELTGKISDTFSVSIYPKLQSLTHNGKLLKEKTNGMFTNYLVEGEKRSTFKVDIKQVKKADFSERNIPMGKAGVPQQPSEEDFSKAAVWKIHFSYDIKPQQDIYLRISYLGDVARVYSGDKLLTDNFYNGNVFELGLQRFSSNVYNKDLTVKILPLQKDTPIYLPINGSMPTNNQNSFLNLKGIKVIENQMLVLEAM